MKITKKCNTEYFEKILTGQKTFELRLNDFDINEGDTLLLKEWNPDTKSYTGRELEKKVGFVGRWTLDEMTKFFPRADIEQKGLQVISLKD